MPTEKSAGAVLFRIHRPKRTHRYRNDKHPLSRAHREYLLLRYEAGHWDFPKGHLEGSEEPEDAARREIREETGLHIQRFRPGFRQHMRYWLWSRGDRGKPRKTMKVVTFFLADAKTRDIRLSWEHTGYAWLPYRDAVKLATYESAKELLCKAEMHLRKSKHS